MMFILLKSFNSSLVFTYAILSLALPSVAENIALDKKYALNPKPNYALSNDTSDIVNLTDGIKKGSYWGLKSTVGWKWPSENPEITIDLNKLAYFEEIIVYSAAGRRGSVVLYDGIIVLVSNDNVNYTLVAYHPVESSLKKVALSESMISPAIDIKAVGAGRFVKLIFLSEGSCYFFDEIEIYSNESTANSTYAKKNFPIEMKSNYAFEAIKSVNSRLELIEEINHAYSIYLNNNEIVITNIFDQYKTFKNRIAKLDICMISDNELKHIKKEFAGFKASIYEHYYGEKVVVLPADPGRVLRRRDVFLLDVPNVKYEIILCKDEFDVFAFNVINCSNVYIDISSFISPLMNSGGEMLASEKVFNIRYGYYTYGKNVGYNADALVLGSTDVKRVAPGEILQIWVTVNSKTLEAGEYDVSIKVVAMEEGLKKMNSIDPIPVALEVSRFSLPPELSLSTYNWAYPQLSEITKTCLSDAASDLQSHYINVQIIPPQIIPFPIKSKLFAKDKMLGSTFKMDRWIRLNSDSRLILLFLGFNSQRKDSGFFGKWMSPSWKLEFQRWLWELTSHLNKMEIGYDRFAIYPFDEYIGEDFYEFSDFVKEIAPEVKIFANSFGKGPNQYNRIKDKVDIWCLPLSVVKEQENWFRDIKEFGKPVWVYFASKRAAEPLNDYREICWWAFKNGVEGVGFWVYCDTLRWTWDDYVNPKGDYSIIYGEYNSPITTQECIIPSRRWENWRLGVQDYEYLCQLRKKIDQLFRIDEQKAMEIESDLEQIVQRIVLYGGTSDSYSQAKRAIIESIIAIDDILR